MTRMCEALYLGKVVHKRLRPQTHALRYTVFAVLFDCDRLDALERRLRLFSYNRFNLFSLYDRDHGDGAALRSYLREVAAEVVHSGEIKQFLMLCYPRILGYAFNPVTVYFGLDANGRVQVVIYEVNNTFGERKSYVLPAEPNAAGLIEQRCRKRLYVSPFNADEGTYSFHVTPLGDDFTLGVALRDESGPLLKAHFRGQRADLTDKGLLFALARTGWMTAKVTAGIHYEAAKLWLKGLQLVPRPAPPGSPVAFMEFPKEDI